MKILVVDDDKIIREQIIGQIDWGGRYVFAGEAANGKDALTAFRSLSADLIITDIYMPVMNGIELIKAVKSIDPKTQILVMSNYDDFQYVKEAMKFGAYDYVLKYKINTPMLSGLLATAEERIRDVRTQEEEWSRLTELVYNQQRQYLSELLRDICLGRCTVKQVMAIAESGQDHLLSGNFFVFHIMHKLPGFLSVALGLWGDGWGAELAEEEAVLLVEIECKSESQKQVELFRRAKELSDLMCGEKHIVVYSTTPVRIDKLATQVGLLRQKSEQYFYHGKSIFLYDPQAAWNVLDEDNFIELKKELLNAVHHCDPKGVKDAVNSLFNILRDSASEPGRVRRVLRKVLYDMIDEMRELPYATKESQDALHSLDERIGWWYSLDDILDEFISIIDAYFAQEKGNEEMRSEAAEAVRYILRHYRDNITLQGLAEHVGLSKNHFCTVFREQTGEYYVDFLNKVRIEEAKKLLKENMQVQEAAYAVGINDPRYFSKLFKKYTKVLPKDYVS